MMLWRAIPAPVRLIMLGVFRLMTLSLAIDLILKRAIAVEKAVHDNHGQNIGTAYRGKIRSLYVNLKDKNNPGLRENIVAGEISAEKFSTMSSEVRSSL